MKVEVQLRTITMEAWANLEHKLRYKKNLSGELSDKISDETASAQIWHGKTFEREGPSVAVPDEREGSCGKLRRNKRVISDWLYLPAIGSSPLIEHFQEEGESREEIIRHT